MKNLNEPRPITASDQPIPQWAVAAVERLNRHFPDLGLTGEGITIASRIIARHAPTPSAESDTAIVEWLEREGHSCDQSVYAEPSARFCARWGRSGVAYSATLRSALLAAMKGEQGEGKQ